MVLLLDLRAAIVLLLEPRANNVLLLAPRANTVPLLDPRFSCSALLPVEVGTGDDPKSNRRLREYADAAVALCAVPFPPIVWFAEATPVGAALPSLFKIRKSAAWGMDRAQPTSPRTVKLVNFILTEYF